MKIIRDVNGGFPLTSASLSPVMVHGRFFFLNSQLTSTSYLTYISRSNTLYTSTVHNRQLIIKVDTLRFCYRRTVNSS